MTEALDLLNELLIMICTCEENNVAAALGLCQICVRFERLIASHFVLDISLFRPYNAPLCICISTDGVHVVFLRDMAHFLYSDVWYQQMRSASVTYGSK